MKLLLDYAMHFVDQPYRWGGESPLRGFDCSGLVQEILKSAGEDPAGDQTAQALYDHFEKNGHYGLCNAGCIAFFGKDALHVTHVGFCIDPYRMIEAGGGDSSVKTRTDAEEKNAFVRIRLIKSRSDLVATIKPYYNKIGAIC